MRTNQEVLNEVMDYAFFSGNSDLMEILFRDRKAKWENLGEREFKINTISNVSPVIRREEDVK